MIVVMLWALGVVAVLNILVSMYQAGKDRVAAKSREQRITARTTVLVTLLVNGFTIATVILVITQGVRAS